MLILKLLRERVSEKNKIESSFYVYIAVGRGAFYDFNGREVVKTREKRFAVNRLRDTNCRT